MAQVKDPVCGMMIDSNNAAGSSDYQGTRYYFCSMDCKNEFDENPGDYASAKSRGSDARPDARS